MKRAIYRYSWRWLPDDGDEDWVLFLVRGLGRTYSHDHTWPFLGDPALSRQDRATESVSGTQEQFDRWADAEDTFITAVQRAAARHHASRLRLDAWRRLLPKRSQAAMSRRADARRRRATRKALTAYRPVRDEIQPLWDEGLATRLAGEERERRERVERFERATAAYDAWWGLRAAGAALAEQEAWALTDAGDITYQSRGGGRTAYELALAVAGREEAMRWTPQAREAVVNALGPDATVLWWARVCSAARNRQALDAARARCVAAITRVLHALIAAGDPGIEDHRTESNHQQFGWKPTFDWSRRGAPSFVLEEPPPPPNFPHGRWSLRGIEYFGKFAEAAILVPTDPDSQIAWPRPAQYHRPQYWTYTSIENYIDIAFDDGIVYTQEGWPEASRSFTLADEVDPAELVPYIESTADAIVGGFERLLDQASGRG
jgi:hypothetical protein